MINDAIEITMKTLKSLLGRPVVGLTVSITITGKKGARKFVARVDSGATMSSLDKSLAKELGLTSVVRYQIVKSASGTSRRPVVRAKLLMKGKEMMAEFNLVDRSHMKYKCLVGCNILKRGFLIDPKK